MLCMPLFDFVVANNQLILALLSDPRSSVLNKYLTNIILTFNSTLINVNILKIFQLHEPFYLNLSREMKTREGWVRARALDIQ